MDDSCEICGDGFGSICKTCREDPANVDWVKARETPIENIRNNKLEDDPWGKRIPEKAAAIIRALCRVPDAKSSEIAKMLGVPRQSVNRIKRQVFGEDKEFAKLYRNISKEVIDEIPKSGTSSQHRMGACTKYAIIQAAWREWQGASAWNGTNEIVHSMPLPPRGWVQEELGFRLDSGPSIVWTCKTLRDTNRRALSFLGREAPIKITYPKDFYDTRMRR